MLPNGSGAVVDPAKVRDYLLSQIHPVGRFKSAVFRALGYIQEGWELLRHDLLTLAATVPAVAFEAGPYGRKYVVSGNLIGPNGRSGAFRTVWLLEPDASAPRFLTAYPE